MIYLDYLDIQHKYILSLQEVDKILNEKELLFQRTQPKSPVTDIERVSGGSPENKIETYIVELERKKIDERLKKAKVDERLKKAKEIMHDRHELYLLTSENLKGSRDKYDMIFVLKWIDGKNAKEISRLLHYSESHVYRMINKIKKRSNMIENEKK